MKRVLVTGAGGGPAINFTRSLRISGEDFHLIGVDADKYCLQRAETDERHLVPRCDAPDYLDVVNALIRRTRAELLYVPTDVEIEVLSENRDRLACRTFLPSREAIAICQNKFSSYDRWRAAKLRVPRTMMISDDDDLRAAFTELGPRIWIRDVRGAFGKGSLPTASFAQARAWLDFQQGWGHYCAAEQLEPESVTWQSIWREGELVVAQSRRRLYWEFANRAPSGVTGITGTGVTMADEAFDRLALDAILAIDARPHGIWSVDMTLDREGVPNPTEINVARFFTTHLFFSEAGLNMPHIFVRLAFDEPPPDIPRKVNPLPVGLAWVRGMDCEPILTTMAKIDDYETELRALRDELRGERS